MMTRSMGRYLIFALTAVVLILGLAGFWAIHFFSASPHLDEADASLRQAEAAILAREYPQALAHLRHCLELCPLNAEAHFLMARTSRRAGRLQDSRNHLERAAILYWPRAQIALEQQLQRAQVGDIWQLEDALLDRLNTHPPEEVLILEALVNGLLENDRLIDVLVLTSAWMREFPRDWLPLVYRANARLAPPRRARWGWRALSWMSMHPFWDRRCRLSALGSSHTVGIRLGLCAALIGKEPWPVSGISRPLPGPSQRTPACFTALPTACIRWAGARRPALS